MKRIILLFFGILFTFYINAQVMDSCVFFQNNFGDLMYGNKLRGKVGRLVTHLIGGGGYIHINIYDDFPGGTKIGRQAHFKDYGLILGEKIGITEPGEATRLTVIPYRHTGGPWNIISRDTQADALLDFNYGSNKNLLTIQHQGFVGLGVANPKNRLEVNGTIRSKEVKIEATGWSDFVFDKDYKLPSLTEVENHIKEHKHLPDVPSEAEVMENGINVAEMQAKLLQKIEELTLYVIDQQKEIKELKEELKTLKQSKD